MPFLAVESIEWYRTHPEADILEVGHVYPTQPKQQRECMHEWAWKVDNAKGWNHVCIKCGKSARITTTDHKPSSTGILHANYLRDNEIANPSLE